MTGLASCDERACVAWQLDATCSLIVRPVASIESAGDTLNLSGGRRFQAQINPIKNGRRQPRPVPHRWCYLLLYMGDLSVLKMLPSTCHSPFTRVHASTNFPTSSMRCPLGPSIPSW